ncbi:MAG: hypothetical protein ACI8PZ_006373, partial [Myxococcota bacterium]
DDDCDGLFDEEDPDIDVFTLIAWGPDRDLDGYGTDSDIMFACRQPDGWGFANRDCDDTRDDINPDMPEICNPDEPVDDDCDGLVDDDDPDVSEDSYLEWYADRDDDGFGSGVDFEYACGRPDGTAPNDDDCDDADDRVGAPALWYGDADGDGFGGGDPLDPVPSCGPPVPDALPDWRGVDCDEADPTINPGAFELCENGVDEDCNGVDDLCECSPLGPRAPLNTLGENTAAGCWDGNPCAYDTYSWDSSHGQNYTDFGQRISCTGPTTCVRHVGITTYSGSTTVCQGSWDVLCNGRWVGVIETLGMACAGSAMSNGCQTDFVLAEECSEITLEAIADGDGTAGCCGSPQPDSMITSVSAW